MADNKKSPVETEEIIDANEEILEQAEDAAESIPEQETQAEEEDANAKNKKKEKKHSKTYSQKEMDAVAEELLKTKNERDEFLLMAQRQKAEFDNFRKRSESQRLEANGNGVRDTITAILPVVDNMQRAMTQCTSIPDDDPLKQGISMVFKQLDETLKSFGLEKIEALGEAFDHNFHHAVVEGEATEEYPAGTVMEVLQDGYKVKEKIIRYAMVKVAK
ncbi:MAG: nucleotide exchange factor GrpE [Eubacteriales bacterium]